MELLCPFFRVNLAGRPGRMFSYMAFLCLRSAPLRAQWVGTNGPYGGRIDSLAAFSDSTGATSLVAGGPYGDGIYVSTDDCQGEAKCWKLFRDFRRERTPRRCVFLQSDCQGNRLKCARKILGNGKNGFCKMSFQIERRKVTFPPSRISSSR